MTHTPNISADGFIWIVWYSKIFQLLLSRILSGIHTTAESQCIWIVVFAYPFVNAQTSRCSMAENSQMFSYTSSLIMFYPGTSWSVMMHGYIKDKISLLIYGNSWNTNAICGITMCDRQHQLQLQLQNLLLKKYTDMYSTIMRLKPMRVYLPHYFMDYHYIANILTSVERAG